MKSIYWLITQEIRKNLKCDLFWEVLCISVWSFSTKPYREMRPVWSTWQAPLANLVTSPGRSQSGSFVISPPGTPSPSIPPSRSFPSSCPPVSLLPAPSSPPSPQFFHSPAWIPPWATSPFSLPTSQTHLSPIFQGTHPKTTTVEPFPFLNHLHRVTKENILGRQSYFRWAPWRLG